MSLNNNNSTVKKPTPPTGTTESPYLGSKISLVSKAKIRYEGILYTIDANESTVALSKVRSFGTEDRPTDRPVPARDEIFEYIIFRGADIEDLQVREPPQTGLTQDPAIVESSMYPSSARSTTTTTSTNNNNNNNNFGGNNQTRSSINPDTFSSSANQQGPGRGTKSASNNDPLRQLNFNQQQPTKSYNNQQSNYGQVENQRRGGGGRQQDYNNDNTNRRGNNNPNYGNYSEWPRTNNNSAWETNYRQPNQRYPRQQNYDTNRFYPTRRTNNNQQSNGYYNYHERRNSTGELTNNNQQQQQRTNRQQRERADSTRGNNTNQSALKFIGDFDFEKSNAEFDKNAIEDELKKSLSIKTNKDKDNQTTTTTTTEKENNQQDQEQEQPTQPEQQQDQPTLPVDPEQEQEGDGFYDKQKSFFDRISCETTEKDKTNPSRRNWNEERRLNAETFGLRYRPAQQGGNQRNNQNGSGYYNNNTNRRYNNSGQQSYYGNGARYQRGGNQQRGRHTTYYDNTNRRQPAY